MQLGRIYLLRHGQTCWAVSGQHTGRTDVPLTDVGRQQAKDAGARIRAAHPEPFDAVFTSPLVRARETAHLAGFDALAWDDVMEWDYGRAEGHTRAQISEVLGRPWNIWMDGPRAVPEQFGGDGVEVLQNGQQVDVHRGIGESIDEVFDRASRVAERLQQYSLDGKDVLVVAHSHILRLVAMAWVGLDPEDGRRFELETAHYIVLSEHKGQPVIERWSA